MTIRILLADDHQIVREGLRLLIERQPDISVVAEAGDGFEAVALAESFRPDIVVMDIKMPGMDGIEATEELQIRAPETKVVALSMYADRNFISEMLRAGAKAFLLKDCASTELVEAIRTVYEGRIYLGPSVSKIVARMYVHFVQQGTSPGEEKLTAREREVLIHLAEGKTNREIANLLHLSVKTIGTHRQNIMRKLGLETIADLVKYAIREGLISSDQQ
ncbi:MULTISPECIES: response regulator [Aminobacterium]|jgi:DNA-binding NarL/FixJ family response regulator|uniref:response regulator n=1 Tax=Aminobacterium TaxID=81466 RepID=UPI0025803AA4|nr:response regulator transcription factor [Aminobacterium sp. UBA4834]